MKQKRFSGRVALCRALFTVLAAAALFPAAPALAHSVYIFAWPEQGRLCSESYFGGKSKVRQGRVAVYDAEGRLLATGLTNDDGLACFAAPEKAGDLLFEINAGQGHRGTFLLPAAQLEAAAGQAEAPSLDGNGAARPLPDDAARAREMPGAVADGREASGPGLQAPGTAGAGADRSDAAQDGTFAPLALENLVRQAVRDEIRREIDPLRKSLLEARAPDGPGWRDIVGGLGWIVGFAGLAAWFAGRKGRP